jgi:nitrite reductase (NADH) large subunit
LFPDDEPGIASWPANAVVCNCRRITKGELQAQMRTCGADAAALSRCTGAGGVCGSCKPLLIELVGKTSAAPVRVPYTGALSGVALAAVALALLLFSAPSLSSSRSVQDEWHALDLVRSSTDYRQITGFTIAGLSLLSLVVSLRKRFNFFARASFGGVRALHALLGSLALVALIAHTGLRLGNGLNAALMVCFVAAALAGGVAARTAAAESSISARTTRIARRLRRPFTLIHLLVLWPLPVLLGIHIFAAYYF